MDLASNNSHAARLNITDARRFVTGGHARFTVVSKATALRRTFEVTACEDKPGCFFVSLLVGQDNEGSYRYLCFLFTRADGTLGAKLNKDGWGSSAMFAFEWLLSMFNSNSPKFDQCEFWHEGTCCRCGRTLTTPESILAGIGPVCAEKGAL